MTHLRIAVLLIGLVHTTLAAGPTYWDSPGANPFAEGEFDGAALDERGRLVPGLAAEVVMADSSLVLWTAVVADNGDVWIGSGHEGTVWRLDKRGRVAAAIALETEEVFALLSDADGVLAGCGPNGLLARIDREGRVDTVDSEPGGYIWDLVRGLDGTVYCATGSPAGVSRLTCEGRLERVVDLPCANSLDLAVTEDGGLLVATQGPGRVFHVRPDRGEASLVLALEQDEVRQIVRGPDGWYAYGYQAELNGHEDSPPERDGGPLNIAAFDFMVTADADVQPVRSVLYRLDTEAPVRVWSSERMLGAVAWSDDFGWLAGGPRRNGDRTVLHALDVPNGRRPVAAWDGGDILDLVVVAGGDDADVVLALQTQPGALVRLRAAGRREALMTCAPLSSAVPVRWSRLMWRGVAGGGEPSFAVRTGTSPSPDTTWLPWRDLDGGRDLELDKVSASRSLQWRVMLPPGSRVDAVTVSAVAPNLAPMITHFTVEEAGPVYRGGMLTSPDNVTQHFRSGLKVEYNLASRRDRRTSRERAALLRSVRAFTWHASDPNEDRLVSRLSYRLQGQTDWLPVGPETREQVQAWDTAGLADGWYEVSLAVSDRRENPAGVARSVERVIGPLAVDNTAPTLDEWSLKHQHDGFSLQLRARDEFGPLAGAELELPDGSRERLDPVDGICDSNHERFDTTLEYPRRWSRSPVRPWSVRVRVWDLNGNVAEVTGVLK